MALDADTFCRSVSASACGVLFHTTDAAKTNHTSRRCSIGYGGWRCADRDHCERRHRHDALRAVAVARVSPDRLSARDPIAGGTPREQHVPTRVEGPSPGVFVWRETRRF